MTDQTTQPEQIEQTEQAAAEAVVITLPDLELATRIIGAAIERGAIKAPESEDVGRVWKKLAAFVNQAVQNQGEQAPQEDAATETVEG